MGTEGKKESEKGKSSAKSHGIPEFERAAKSDPDFFAWFGKQTCLKDGKALPAKYRLLIHMCLLARIGHVRSLPVYVKQVIEEYGGSELEIIEAFETSMLAGGVPTMIRGLAALVSYEESKGGKAQ